MQQFDELWMRRESLLQDTAAFEQEKLELLRRLRRVLDDAFAAYELVLLVSPQQASELMDEYWTEDRTDADAMAAFVQDYCPRRGGGVGREGD